MEATYTLTTACHVVIMITNCFGMIFHSSTRVWHNSANVIVFVTLVCTASPQLICKSFSWAIPPVSLLKMELVSENLALSVQSSTILRGVEMWDYRLQKLILSSLRTEMSSSDAKPCIFSQFLPHIITLATPK